MSGQEYTRLIESSRKALNTMKKDIEFRDGAVLRNEPTYTLDAQIKGQFIQIEEHLDSLQSMLRTFQKKAKQYNLMQRDLDKRKQALDANIEEKNKLKRIYEESLARKVPNTRAAQEADKKEKFDKEYEGKVLTKADHLRIKEQQEAKQDEAIDGLIGTVRQMKNGHKDIQGELQHHEGLLNRLEDGIDENALKMGKIRRNLNKLLESSSYCCLIIVIIIEIAGIVCNLILWPKH